VTNAWPFGEGAAPGRGKLSTPLPTPGLAEGRTSDTKPASILRIGVKEMSAADTRPLSAILWGLVFRGPAERPTAPQPFMPALPPGTEGGVPPFPIGRCELTLGSAPFRRLAELVGFGNRGMRDCATPNSTRLPLSQRYAVGMADLIKIGAPDNENRQVQQGNSGQ
jgi:hypothetical protein